MHWVIVIVTPENSWYLENASIVKSPDYYFELYSARSLFIGLSGDFFHSSKTSCFSWDNLREGFSAFKMASLFSSNALYAAFCLRSGCLSMPDSLPVESRTDNIFNASSTVVASSSIPIARFRFSTKGVGLGALLGLAAFRAAASRFSRSAYKIITTITV